MNDEDRLKLRMRARRACGISKRDAESLEKLFQEWYYKIKISAENPGIIPAKRGRPPKIELRTA